MNRKLAVADHGVAPRGKLVIGANEATCLYVLPDVFAKYCGLYPGVQLSIYRNFSYKIVEKLENGSIDVGIVTLPVKSSTLKTHPIFRDQLMWMVHPQSPLAKHDVVSISEVARQPILLPKTGYMRRLMDKLFQPLQVGTASSNGAAKRGDDQELCGRGTRSFADQRELRP